jgi:arabinosaccharide transport system substrate-binding protein
MTFPLGKPILVMIVAAALSGLLVLVHRPSPRTDLTIWTFASDRGFELEPSLLQGYTQRTGQSVGVKVMVARALDTRLVSLFMLFMQSAKNAQCPDVVEVEIGSVGKYFRPLASDVGFLPWNDYLEKTGLGSEFLPARLDVWSKDGQIFGLPQDVHPVSLTYRKDLYDEAGVDPTLAHTWPELQQACLRFQAYWQAHGQPRRHAMELATHATDYLTIMLQQRHIPLLDGENHISMADPKVARTIAFYTAMVAGPGQIGGDANLGPERWINDVTMGDLCMVFTADWVAGDLRENGPELRGKLAMMPLPRFDPDDAPTASWGGTMMAIPRFCQHPEEARRLAVFLTTTQAAMDANRLAGFDLIPPLPGLWTDPVYHQPDPYFMGNQSVDDLYVSLARQLPSRYVTPFTAVAEAELSAVLGQAVDYRRRHGESGLTEKCQQWLDDAAADLERRIQFGTTKD